MNNDAKVKAVGVLFYSIKTDRHLFLMRNDNKYRGCWGLPGGKIEKGELLLEAIERECIEEMGIMPDYLKLVPIEKFTSAGNHFCFHTFYCIINDEFVPELNHEHIGYAWVNSGVVPKPLHPGFWATLKLDDILTRIQTIKELYTSG
jgi:ADP-ribose pyrophosphatase YjhB (NUDIX family)